jgi:hypothetical protein
MTVILALVARIHALKIYHGDTEVTEKHGDSEQDLCSSP